MIIEQKYKISLIIKILSLYLLLFNNIGIDPLLGQNRNGEINYIRMPSNSWCQVGLGPPQSRFELFSDSTFIFSEPIYSQYGAGIYSFHGDTLILKYLNSEPASFKNNITVNNKNIGFLTFKDLPHAPVLVKNLNLGVSDTLLTDFDGRLDLSGEKYLNKNLSITLLPFHYPKPISFQIMQWREKGLLIEIGIENYLQNKVMGGSIERFIASKEPKKYGFLLTFMDKKKSVIWLESLENQNFIIIQNQ